MLLANGADPNLTDYSGWTPLHFAVDNDALELVRVLLEYGGDLTIPNIFGRTSVDLIRSDEMRQLVNTFREYREAEEAIAPSWDTVDGTIATDEDRMALTDELGLL